MSDKQRNNEGASNGFKAKKIANAKQKVGDFGRAFDNQPENNSRPS